MKKVFLLFLTLFLTFSIFANDTFFSLVGGNIIPSQEGEIAIEMQQEVIYITFNPEYYEVSVEFDFFNLGETITLLVGFPYFEVGIDGHGLIYDFKCWTNNKETNFSDKPIDTSWKQNRELNKDKLKNAYTRKITFEKNSVTKTKISYKSDYGSSSSSLVASYLYGTGSSWKNPIQKITLILENNVPYAYPSLLIMNKKDSYEDISTQFSRISDNKFQTTFYNIEPSYTDTFTFNLTNILNDTGPKIFPSYFYFNRKHISKDDLFWYTKPQLRLIRNTIYALHGYSFKSKDLQEFFSYNKTKNWEKPYTVNPNFSEDELSQIEKDNIKTILTEEQNRK